MSDNSGNGTTILAVDDRPDNLFTIEKVITDHLPECTVLTAGSAAGGLSIADDTPLDGMLIDVQMPRMGGIEMCRHLKANSATAHIPVILMTAHGASPTQKATGLNAGADDFINKPIDNTELVARISAILRIKKTEDQLRRSTLRLAALADRRTKQLADSEHYYRSLIYSLHEDVMVIDGNYAITDMNSSFLASVGRSAEEVIGHHCYEISYGYDNPCDQYGQECPLRKVFDTGLPCRCRHTHTGEDGAKVHVDILISPMKDGDGNITHVVEAVRDITDLMEAQAQQHASDRRYRSVVEDSPGLICRFGPEGIITFVNDAYCRYFVKGPQELIGSNFLSLIPADSREAVMSEISALTADSPVSSHEHQVIAPGGEVRWQRWTNRALFDEEGQLVAYQAFGEDITDRKRTEEQVADLARFPSESPYPVLRILSDGTILHANPAAARLLADHGPSTDGQAPDDWREYAATAMESGAVVRREFHYGQKTFAFHFAPLVDAGYVNVYGTDITEQKDMETQLRQAQKMEAIGQLAGGVAHDFRNQLTVIQGYASMMLRRSPGKEKSHECLKVILDAVDRASTITNQLLVFSRKESLHMETVDLTESVADMSKLLPQMIGEDIRLLAVSNPEACCANVDPGLFQQAIMNLVVNARHAMPDGGELTIETGCVEMDRKALRGNPDAAPGPYAVVTVSDTGTGMDADMLAKIFDPFFTTKEVGMGTGMGLAMVYGFTVQSEGFIQVDSKLGQGSTFRLYFPLVRCAETSTKAASTLEPGTLPKGAETLLVVEDEEAVRHLIVSVLRECGYTVLEASNAYEALPLGEHYEGRIDLLVTDVVMPKLNGVEMSERLRNVRPDMAVLFVSGHGDSAVSESILMRPGTEMLTKPMDDMTLARAVRRMLDRAKSTRQKGQ